MKIKLILFLAFFLCPGAVYSQFDYYVPVDSVKHQPEVVNRHFAGQSMLSVAPAVITSPAFGQKFAGGIKLQIFLGKRVSVDADLVIGKDYIHTGPGIIAIPFWLLYFTGSGINADDTGGFAGFLFVLAATVLSFEHLSYHIPLQNNFELAPYISALRFRSVYTPESTGDMSEAKNNLAFAAGFQVDKFFGRFYLSPYVEYCAGYSDHISGINAGIGLGIAFPGKQP